MPRSEPVAEPVTVDPVEPARVKGDVCAEVDAIVADARVPAEQKRRDIAEVKARALAASSDGFTVEAAGKTWTVTGVEYLADVNMVQVRVEGVPDHLNPFRFGNPPIMVPDGTFTEGTGPDGERVRVENLREDPAAALAAIVVDAVALVL